MGFRFSRRIKVAPGVRLNISNSGVSTSVGRKGAWLTFGSRGTRSTVGVPGTGVSYLQIERNGGGSGAAVALILLGLLFVWLFF